MKRPLERKVKVLVGKKVHRLSTSEVTPNQEQSDVNQN